VKPSESNLNRTDDGNAIPLKMAGELLDVARRCDQDPEIRAG
jgi:enoyl-CoA hydratase/carnithine racemase